METVAASSRVIQIALVGNPNAGKSSLFNQLTGLRQKVGNFPGVTVERKSGYCKLPSGQEARIIDLPGTYSLYPSSLDERTAVQALIDPGHADYPDALIYIADVTHLESHMLLLTQLMDLGFPVVVALNMNDVAEQHQVSVSPEAFTAQFGIPAIKINGRTGEGVEAVKAAIAKLEVPGQRNWYSLSELEKKMAAAVRANFQVRTEYEALLMAHHSLKLLFFAEGNQSKLNQELEAMQVNRIDLQLDEIMRRYNTFIPKVNAVISRQILDTTTWSGKLDRVLTHRIAGPLIFFAMMFLVFQAIFAWAVIPMDWIDGQFAHLAVYFQERLPDVWWARLLTEGLLPGISGVLVFVPQITILFFLITLLEELGYMARAVFMFDHIMRKFGLNGRSIVSLISGGACAIPALMSTRTIQNWKERLITIMVTPLISCSARIPVFAVLIGFVLPATKVGYFNLQGIVFMLLYIFGAFAALTAAYVFKKILKTEEPSYLMLELPAYRAPHWKNVFLTLYEKVASFVFGAGKIILMVSLVLWFLASYGPSGKMQQAEAEATAEALAYQWDEPTTDLHVAAKKLEYSYAGYAGRVLEPVIRPLGFDWKIGIALITSFAAREVFVGTISTLYSIGKDANELTIREKLQQEKNRDGQPVFSMATSLSLIVFYLLAMQCMSTLATVYRETQSWKWPAWQFVYMTGGAYLFSLVVYQVLR